jgi:hypothetical protein
MEFLCILFYVCGAILYQFHVLSTIEEWQQYRFVCITVSLVWPVAVVYIVAGFFMAFLHSRGEMRGEDSTMPKGVEHSNQSTPNEAYFDRNQAVMAFARLAQKIGWTVGMAHDAAEPDWPVLFVDTPHGQMSWHLPANEIELSEWPAYPGQWDGHTVQEKRIRLAELIGML